MLSIIITLLILSGTITLFLGMNASHGRDMPAATAFAVTMCAASIWAFGYAAEVVSNSLQYKIFWANIQYIGINILPLSWLAMILYYTGQPRWTVRSLPVLSLVPLVATLVIWTDPYHHIFRGTPSLERVNQYFSVLNNDYGLFYYAILMPFIYFLFAISIILLVRFLRKSAYRRQGLILLISLLFPLLLDILYTLNISPIPNFNFAAISFSFSGLFVSWKVFSLRFLDITPLANDVVIRRMQFGVIAMDKWGRISDLNPAAEEITGISAAQYFGTPISEVLPIFTPYLESDSDTQAEITIKQDGETHHYDLRVSLVSGMGNRIIGRVITLYDISEKMKLFQQVKVASMTDSLTGVHNRRAFIERGDIEISRSLRYERQLSAIMIDIDNFKTINDEHGHSVGDNALVVISQLCRQQMRSSDIIARYGGDEFVILLPETSAKYALNLADRICQEVDGFKFSTESGTNCSLSVSLGIAELTGKQTLRSLLHQADKALYKAKHAGKNQVMLI